MTVIIDGSAGITTPGETNTGNLSVAGSTTLTTPLPVASGGTGATSLSGIAVGNLSGGSNGTIPYQSASGTTQMLAVGTSGQVLQTNGAGAPSWVTPSVGAMTLISTQTVTTPARYLTFTGLSTYDKYLLIYQNLILNSATAALQLQVGYGGTPTYITTGYNNYILYGLSGTGYYSTYSNNNTFGICTGIGASTTGPFNGVITLSGMTTLNNVNIDFGSFASGGTNFTGGQGSGSASTGANQITAIRLIASDISFAGSASLYGISS